MKDFRELVHTAAVSYKLAATRREHIWHDLHLKRLSMWKNMTDTLGVEIDDPLLEQSFYQEVVELCMKEYFANDARGKESDVEAYCIILTPDDGMLGDTLHGSCYMFIKKKEERCIGNTVTVSVKWL